MIRVGVIGYGHWGKDLGRNLVNNPKFKLVRIAEWDADLRAAAQQVFPNTDVISDARALCSDPEIDLVVITTKASMQHDLVRRAIANDKRVIVGAGRYRRRRSKPSKNSLSASPGAWYRTALCCASIFYLSSLSDPSQLFPEWLVWPNSDKLAHAIIFGGLAGVVAADLFRWKGHALASRTLFLVPTLFAISYGLLDETHQLFVLNRSSNILDLLADAAGAVTIAGAIAFRYDRSQRKEQSSNTPWDTPTRRF